MADKQDYAQLERTQNVWASADTRAMLGALMPHIEGLAPNAHVMIVRARDLHVQAPQYDWENLYAAEDDAQPTKNNIDAWHLHSDAQDNLLKMIRQADGFVDKHELIEVAMNQHIMLDDILMGTVDMTLQNSESNYYLPAYLDVSQESCITVLSENIKPALQNASEFAGLHQDYLNNIPGTDFEWAAFTIGHEIAGHCASEHFNDLTKRKYDSIKINTQSVHDTVNQETVSDVAATEFYAKLLKEGVVNTDEVPQAVEAMRALGSLINSNNLYSIQTTGDLHTHTTNGGLSNLVNGTSSKTNFNISALAHAPVIPSLINTYVDALIGAELEYIKKPNVIENPHDYDADTYKWYATLPDNLAQANDHIKEIISQGETRRQKNPQYHYAAMKALNENGIFTKLENMLGEPYGPIVHEYVSDYMTAADTYAKGLNNGLLENYNDAFLAKKEIPVKALYDQFVSNKKISTLLPSLMNNQEPAAHEPIITVNIKP